ncbi:hypothetical protein AVEN_235559-1 [Araneus ventricosus]|uniref:Uncharacterized protein n=1 Tax=Araneus ventricosus TaxID=182803 RepID=A0A4Y2ITZ2_ARAVE|nr:hypothetical protein AVEN_235559-1 [Araneus ventricosus]
MHPHTTKTPPPPCVAVPTKFLGLCVFLNFSSPLYYTQIADKNVTFSLVCQQDAIPVRYGLIYHSCREEKSYLSVFLTRKNVLLAGRPCTPADIRIRRTVSS